VNKEALAAPGSAGPYILLPKTLVAGCALNLPPFFDYYAL
jgi:hypothetical protein